MKLIYLIGFVILGILICIYYMFGYKVGYCIPYDNRCFILNLEEKGTKMIIDGETYLKNKYLLKEAVLFNALENWDYERFPKVTLMLACIINLNRCKNFEEQVLRSHKNYSEYIISIVLSSSWKNSKEYLNKYPYLINYKNSKSPLIRNGFVYFVEGLDQKDTNEILNDMFKVETDQLVLDNIKNILSSFKEKK